MDMDELIKQFEKQKVNTSLLGGQFNPKAAAYGFAALDAFNKNDFQTAISLFTKGLEFQPENSGFYSRRAICYRMINEFDLALLDALTSIKIDSNFENNQTAALCKLFLKDYVKAIEFFEISLEFLERDESIDQSNISNTDYKATKSRLLNNKAVCHYNLKQLDLAIECTSKGIIENPQYSNNYFIRGMIYLEISNKSKAIEDLKNASLYGDDRATNILKSF